MIYTTCFVLKAQINYICFSKKFKVSKLLRVIIFDFLCISNFNTIPLIDVCNHKYKTFQELH